MDYKKTAVDVYEAVGGGENIVSVAHCATRLRLVIADNEKCNRDALEHVEGVKGVFEASGQLQIIFGTGTVNKVYEEFIKIAALPDSDRAQNEKAAAANISIWKRAIKTLGDIFVPIIPAIVASGLLMGLLEGLLNVYPDMADSGTYTIIHLFSNAAFVYLPVLIAMSAAKTFGGNRYLGAVIGMIMIHSDLLNAWNVAAMNSADIPTASVWFGLYHINLVGYQGHVIPVVIAVWFMSWLERKLHKIVPEIIDLFVTPLVTVLVTGYLTLTVIGPVFSTIENYVLDGARALVTFPFGIGAFLLGGFYAPTVVAGVHHMYNAIEAGMLSSGGLNIWMPVATAANVGQGAAALALAVKTKNNKTKSIALPAALSAFLGITEPAIFGVNIRYMKVFLAGCIGGACGGLAAGITGIGATGYGITGVFGFLITTKYALQYALVMGISFVTAFAAAWVLYREKTNWHSIGSVVSGAVLPLSEVPDETFSGEVLGKGFAVRPEDNTIVAPADGVIQTVADTGHAIGMTTADGLELLIHIGIDTVRLQGEHFKTAVTEGQKVTRGQTLVSFDRAAVENAGYSSLTMVIVTNSEDYTNFELKKPMHAKAGEEVFQCSQGER